MGLKATMLGELVRLAARGMPAGQIAQLIGLDARTVYDLKEKYRGLILGEQRRLAGCGIDGTPVGTRARPAQPPASADDPPIAEPAWHEWANGIDWANKPAWARPFCAAMWRQVMARQ